MEENGKQGKYKVHEIVYTDTRGKRAKAFVAEESGQKALLMLEESLINFGYNSNNIEKMLPVSRIVSYGSFKTWIEFR